MDSMMAKKKKGNFIHERWDERKKKYHYCKTKQYSPLPLPRFVELHDIPRVSAWFRLREYIIKARHRAQLTMEVNFIYIMGVFLTSSLFITIIIILGFSVLGQEFFNTTLVMGTAMFVGVIAIVLICLMFW